MRVIILTQGQHTVVADDVYEWANKFKWQAMKGRCTYYAVRKIRLEDGSRATSFLHREIMKASPSDEVDHRDGDGLNNLDENLRICSRLENARNRAMQRNNTSGFKGASFRATRGKWQASIWIAGKQKNLGYFDTAVEAAREYDRAALGRFGEFAKINFPQ